jgi:hypothetical protein
MLKVLSGFAFVMLSGCISAPEGPAAPARLACQAGEPMVETMLYFGRLRPGGAISRFEFAAFVEAEVVPRWREGFTVLEGQGLWLSEQRRITEREPSHILIRLHDGSVAASADIEAIRAAYIKAFDQDAVLRTDRPTCASF